MPRQTLSLFHRIERALETIALASTPLEIIHDTAEFLAANFADDQTVVIVKRMLPEPEEAPA